MPEEGQDTLWTTSSNTEDRSIEFYLTEAGDLIDWGIAESLAAITVATTTVLSQTVAARAAATVVQAADTEVLYFISERATEWGGYAAATDVAQSGTRFTIAPNFSTAEMLAPDAATDTSSATVINNSLTYGLEFTASRFTNVAQTRVANYNQLPNSTFTVNIASTTTQTSSLSGVLFASQRFTLGRTGIDIRITSNTASQVTSHTTRPTTVGRTRGTVSFQSTVNTTTSQARFVLFNATATSTTSGLTTFSTTFSGDGQVSERLSTQESGRTSIVKKNQTAFGPAQINVGIGNTLTRSRFVTAGAALGEQRGLFFSAAQADVLFVPTARVGDEPRATLLFPQTTPNYTLQSNSITYSTTQPRSPDSANTATSETTTESFVYGLGGEDQTFIMAESLTDNRPLQHGALSAGKNYTIIDEAGVGAYKDRIDGTTTSFNGGATFYTSGQSADIRSWFPITHISPLVLETARNGITFSAARNSTALPPNA